MRKHRSYRIEFKRQKKKQERSGANTVWHLRARYCRRAWQVLARGRKSRRCNNFGSYLGFERRPRCVATMPAHDPKATSPAPRSECDFRAAAYEQQRYAGLKAGSGSYRCAALTSC
jgi:hypothetical protein